MPCVRCHHPVIQFRQVTRAVRGCLFILQAPHGTPAIEFCGQCRAEWLMFQARMGYDLHFHDYDAECTQSCLARQAGRRIQRDAMRSIDSKGAFLLSKQFDGMPKVNGVPGIICMRGNHFWSRLSNRQEFYEAVGTYGDMVRQQLIVSELERIGIPRRMRDHHLLAFEIFQSSAHAPKGVLQLPGSNDYSRGLHAVAVTGCSDDGSLIRFWNNWGSAWGDCGYGAVSTEYLESYFFEAWTIRDARWGPTPEKVERFPQQFNREYRRIWEIENPRLRWKMVGKGRTLSMGIYQSLSPRTDEPVECLELRNGFGLRMAWAFLKHEQLKSKPITEITELFVWPIFRRMKLGSMLEDWAIERAHEWGSTGMSLVMNADDAIVGPPSPRTAARRFGTSLGYSWRWVNTISPRIAAVGDKSI